MKDKTDYEKFIDAKQQVGADHGFEPLWMPEMLFPFQQSLVEWATRKGRSAIFADCGLGKTLMQLTWAENIVRKTGGRVLILTPLAVAFQTVKEGAKIGLEVSHRREGLKPGDGIVVTNYERLHYFDPSDFSGVVCDESSILKHYTGATQKTVTRFLVKVPYRLLCTATAAPNDYVELGTSSEAIGELTNSEMLTRFFRYRDNKGQEQDQKAQDYAEKAEQYYMKLSFRVSQSIGQWRLKHHAVTNFWRWVCSWARACRMPSDLGFNDDGFLLPELTERHHVIMPDTPPDGFLFSLPGIGLGEERDERRRTIKQRCEFVTALATHDRPVVVWCHTNDEGDMLEEMIDGAVQVAGKTPDDTKEAIYRDFADGNLRALVIKPKIGAWGLNWQHCSDVITFASHSYEQYYQSVRRCWRFGQKNPVTVDIVATEGERRVMENMRRKADQASRMFEVLVREMNNSETCKTTNEYTKKEKVPTWL
jgi:superfamily II DNA or RNA helicase